MCLSRIFMILLLILNGCKTQTQANANQRQDATGSWSIKLKIGNTVFKLYFNIEGESKLNINTSFKQLVLIEIAILKIYKMGKFSENIQT